MHSQRKLTFVAAILSGALAACDGGDGAVDTPEPLPWGGGCTVLQVPLLRVEPSSDPILVEDPGVEGAGSEVVVTLTNPGDALLAIEGLTIQQEAPEEWPDGTFRVARVAGLCAAGPRCEPRTFVPSGGALPTLYVRPPWSGGAFEGFDRVEVTVAFRSLGDGVSHHVALQIHSDADGDAFRLVQIASRTFAPTLTVAPDVTFPAVALGTSRAAPLVLGNAGLAPLGVHGLGLGGSDAFSVLLDHDGDPESPPQELRAGGSFVLVPALPVAGDGSLGLEVRFTPTSPEPATALLRIQTDDPRLPDGAEVVLWGNTEAPCLEAIPDEVKFGGKGVGLLAVVPLTLRSCGPVPVTIGSIALTEESSHDFGLDPTSLPGLEAGGELPVTLAPGEEAEIRVRYVPDEVESCVKDGKDAGTLVVQSDAVAGSLELPVSGTGVDTGCPQSVIALPEGTVVAPGTTLHLDGTQSFHPDGPVAKWEWTVEQPAGSQALFAPSATVASPTFTPEVVGTYRFRLRTWDVCGTPSCVPDELEVTVAGDEDLRVELVWYTPNDPDQTDEGLGAGTDLDLHLLHPSAWDLGIGWFDLLWDCHHGNWAPDWPPDGSDGDPLCNTDDTDGAGPETTVLSSAEDGATYRIGVFYGADNGFGASYATVRIYVRGVLAGEVADVKLLQGDLWEVATVEWPSGAVTYLTGDDQALRITSGYEPPPVFVP